MNSEKKKFEEWRLSICTVKGYSITWTKLCGEDIPYLRFKNQIIGEIHHEYEAWQASAKARDELIKDKILENKDKLIERESYDHCGDILNPPKLNIYHLNKIFKELGDEE